MKDPVPRNPVPRNTTRCAQTARIWRISRKFMGLSIETVAAIVSALLTALGGAASSEIFKRLIDHLFKRDREPVPDEGIPGPTMAEELTRAGAPAVVGQLLYPSVARFKLAKQQVLVRLRDARQARQKQQSLARWSRWSANSLTFGQYVIGGVMATSFVQKSLSPEIVGVFGVLVVAASLLKQHYHPDINAQNAAQRAGQLETLIRQSEDRLVVIETTMEPAADDPALVLELLERVSAELTRITLAPVEAPPARAVAQRRGK